MFLSYEHIESLPYDSKTRLYKWEYKIVDSEFEVVDVATNRGGDGCINVCCAVMNTYEKRNLNVAANYVRALVWLCGKYGIKNGYGWWTINELINHNKIFIPELFSKYEDDVNKYLMLV